MQDALIANWKSVFAGQKSMADRALAQVSDAQLHERLDASVNPISVIMMHMAGNMRSRWTDFLTSDGEKPDRHRESEFDAVSIGRLGREELLERWEAGWACLFDALETITPDTIDATVTIRGEPHAVFEAVNRQIAHYGHHVGQIVTIARALVGDDAWEWLTVAPGGTEAFNAMMKKKFG